VNATNATLSPSYLTIDLSDADSHSMSIIITTNASGTWSVVNATASLSNGTYTAHNFSWINQLNTTYYLWINLTDGYDWTNESFTITTHSEYIPDPPTSVTATAASSSQINLAWTKGDRANKTMIRYKQGATAPANTSDGTLLYNDTAASTSATGLSASTQYSFKAWSWNDTGGYYSLFNVTTTATTQSAGGGGSPGGRRSSGGTPTPPQEEEIPPVDTDDDGIPDEPTADHPAGDLDDDNDGIPDAIEQLIGSDAKDATDVTNIDSSIPGGFLVDTSGDGIYDTYYNANSQVHTTMVKLSTTAYLIDSNNDGIWDYVYNPLNGAITSYQKAAETPTSSSWYLIGPILGGIIILFLIIVIVWRKKSGKTKQ